LPVGILSLNLSGYAKKNPNKSTLLGAFMQKYRQ
jgi:hypothetical protein